MVFSRRPPMRRSLPFSEISPVIATVAPNGWSNASESKAEANAKPADGPAVRNDRDGNTVFRNCAFGEMDMDLSAVEETISREVLGHENLCKRICNRNGFLEDRLQGSGLLNGRSCRS